MKESEREGGGWGKQKNYLGDNKDEHNAAHYCAIHAIDTIASSEPGERSLNRESRNSNRKSRSPDRKSAKSSYNPADILKTGLPAVFNAAPLCFCTEVME